MTFILLDCNQLQNYILHLHLVGCIVCLPAMSSNKEVTDRLEYLEKTLEKTITDFKKLSDNNRDLKTTIDELTEDIDDLHDVVYDLENQMNDLNQYSRRNNIEIQNIPENILQKDLEEYVIEVLHSIDITID